MHSTGNTHFLSVHAAREKAKTEADIIDGRFLVLQLKAATKKQNRDTMMFMNLLCTS
jgi:hypothetical protein